MEGRFLSMNVSPDRTYAAFTDYPHIFILNLKNPQSSVEQISTGDGEFNLNREFVRFIDEDNFIYTSGSSIAKCNIQTKKSELFI